MYGNCWQLLATYNNIWQLLATSVNFRQQLATFGYKWQLFKLVLYFFELLNFPNFSQFL